MQLRNNQLRPARHRRVASHLGKVNAIQRIAGVRFSASNGIRGVNIFDSVRNIQRLHVPVHEIFHFDTDVIETLISRRISSCKRVQ